MHFNLHVACIPKYFKTNCSLWNGIKLLSKPVFLRVPKKFPLEVEFTIGQNLYCHKSGFVTMMGVAWKFTPQLFRKNGKKEQIDLHPVFKLNTARLD